MNEQDTKLNTDFILNQWVPALRSGKYQQGMGVLHAVNDTYCCLGVACDLIANDETVPGPIREVAVDGVMPTSSHAFLPEAVSFFIGIGQGGEDISVGVNGFDTAWPSLAEANDKGASFSTIADALEAEARKQLDS
jgi:hypothetical protein